MVVLQGDGRGQSVPILFQADHEIDGVKTIRASNNQIFIPPLS